jgi:hypothetical protein
MGDWKGESEGAGGRKQGLKKMGSVGTSDAPCIELKMLKEGPAATTVPVLLAQHLPAGQRQISPILCLLR